MKYSIYLTILLWLVLVAPLSAMAGTTGSRLPERAPMSPKDKATLRYDAGMKQFDRAALLEQEVSNESDASKRATRQKKLAKEYNNSIKNFKKAVKFYPRYYEVHASLGQALHKVGRTKESLAAYDKALKINPSYDKAVAYRAELYLDLNRANDAKQAYLSLIQSEPALANQLHAAMSHWISMRRKNPQGVDPAFVDQLATWLSEHNEFQSASQ